MAMINNALYLNIGGVGKLVRSLYNNVGGARKNTTAMYGNLDGISRKVFPISATGEETVAGGSTTYTWEKYNINTTTTTSGPELVLTSNQTILINDPLGTQYGFRTYCAHNASISPYENTTNKYRVTVNSGTRTPVSIGFKPSGYFCLWGGEAEYFGYNGHEPYIMEARSAVYDVSSTEGSSEYNTVYAIDVSIYHYKAITNTTQNKGSYVGTVTSNGSSAYPTNGIRDGYWYVYKGSTSTGPTVYKWNRYNVISSGSTSSESASSYTLLDQSPDLCVYQVNSYTWHSDSSTAVSVTSSKYLGTIGSLSSIPSVNFIITGNNSGVVSPGEYLTLYKGPGTITVSGSVEIGENNYEDRYSINCYKITKTTSSPTYSQGSYIDQVTSTSRSAYPDNNYSGNYWYVYQGSNQSSSNTTITVIYDQIDAIQSSGTQYIDTGLIVNKSDTYEILLDAQLTNNSNYAGANGYLQYQANIAAGVRSNIKISYNGSTGIENVYVNNTLKATENWTSSYNGANVKIGILALGDANNVWWTGGSPQSGTIYSVKITKSGVIVRDYIPVKGNNGTIGLYDLVNNKFYGNSGTGSFSEVPYKLVDGQISAIQSTGTQYIDTGIIPSVGYKAEVDFQAISEPTSNWWILSAVVSASKLWRAGINTSSFRTDGGFTYSQTSSKTSRTIATGTCTTNLTIPLYLFAQNEGGACEFGKYRLYKCKIYDNTNKLVRDFVPYKGSDGVVGLYDLVNSKFYGNSGTGTFTAIE